MASLNDPNNFAGRVRYAASVIATGKNTSRAFDNCFENDDGDEVSVALTRSQNPRIAANLYRYLNREVVAEAVARLANVPNRKLGEAARESRARNGATRQREAQ